MEGGSENTGGLEPFSVESLWHTPHKRVESAIETEFKPHDLVRILIGPAEGKLGVVVIERNANYVDKEPEVGDESIGVSVVEEIPIHPDFRELVINLANRPGALQHSVIRWFDGPEQLELAYREEIDQPQVDSSPEQPK